MKSLPFILLFAAGLAVMITVPSEGPIAVVLCGMVTLTVLLLISRSDGDSAERLFLRNIFICALLLRVFVAVLTFSLDLQDFFQPDSIGYDMNATYLSQLWSGYIFGEPVNPLPQNDPIVTGIANNWGVSYFIGAVYLIAGRNMLAAQMIFSSLGAAAAPLIYHTVVSIYKNKAVARLACVMVAVFPSLVLWSAQGTKDGLNIFLLALTVMAALKLQRKFHIATLVWLLVGTLGVYAVRPYIFFMVAAAVLAGFIVGANTPVVTIARRLILLSFFALLISFSGLTDGMRSYIQKEGSLETVNRHRTYLAAAADSGFGREWDVSTPTKALGVLPIGFAYLMLAPFPWQMENFRQALPLPEMILWWLSIPLLVLGVFYTVKNRLRASITLLLFLSFLTGFYALFQGNVGTAYRQRAQLQVFFLIFVAVGWYFLKERRENKKLIRAASQRQVNVSRRRLLAQDIAK